MDLKIIRLEHDSKISEKNLVICLGFFDGMHKAHMKLIEEAVYIAKAKNLKTGLFTFSMNVMNFIKNKKNQCLTLLDDKTKIAEKAGIDIIYVMEVSEELIHMNHEDFIKRFLEQADTIVVGKDFRFGYKNTGSVKDLTFNDNFYTVIVPEVSYEHKKISSSGIRDVIKKGEMKLASHLLGRNFKIKGKVISGHGVGKKLGFPTANLDYGNYLLPKMGVYYTKVFYNGTKHNALTNIGTRPTYGEHDLSVETYILNYENDLYEEFIEIEFIKFLRPEYKYSSSEKLIEQIKKDVEAANSIIRLEKENEKNK